MNVQSTSPVAVIGTGPVGLAAAAHLAQRGIPFEVFEASAQVAANFQSYRQVRLFSPWRYNVDRAARELLVATGWQAPDEDLLPTAGELVDSYLEPLAQSHTLAPHIHYATRVIAISRMGFDKAKTAGREHADFVLRLQTRDGLREQRARAVIDASGTWSQPNPLGSHGLPAIGEVEAQERIVYGMPDILGADRARYAGRKVLVVGAGHSAAGNLLALATLAQQAPGTRLAWAVRGKDLRRLFGGGENDGLPARGELGLRLRQLVEQGQVEMHLGFGICEIVRTSDGLRILADDTQLPAIAGIDQIVAATGSRPDLSITRELRLRLDPALESSEALAPLIDPNVHSCGTVRPHGHRELAHPETNFYVIGAKSYGRAPNFLMATGYEQARSVVAALAGDLRAADHVQLELPETGVCSSDFIEPNVATGNVCCGSPDKPKTGISTQSTCCG
jgi:thioredoxin reductase